MNMTFTIPDPIITGSQFFKVRYSVKDSGVWTAIANQTNTAFTITGLSAGYYTLEVIFNNGGDCTPVYKDFFVQEQFDCIAFTATMEQELSTFYIHIAYSVPSPYTYPSCGWDIVYTQNGVTTTVPYPLGLPLVGFIDIVVPANLTTTIIIRMNLCNGLNKICHSDSIPPASVLCTPYFNLVATMQKSSGYNLVLTYNQSTPATPFIKMNWKQIGTVPAANGFLDSGSINVPNTPVGAGSPTSLTTKVFPNTFVEPHTVRYEGNFIDVCGVSHYFITAAIPF